MNLSSLFGTPPMTGLDPEMQQYLQQQQSMRLALSLLAAAQPRPRTTTGSRLTEHLLPLLGSGMQDVVTAQQYSQLQKEQAMQDKLRGLVPKYQTPEGFDMQGFLGAMLPEAMAQNPMEGVKMYGSLAKLAERDLEHYDDGENIVYFHKGRPDQIVASIPKRPGPQKPGFHTFENQGVKQTIYGTGPEDAQLVASSPTLVPIQPGGGVMTGPEAIAAASGKAIDPNWVLPSGKKGLQGSNTEGNVIPPAQMPGMRVAKELPREVLDNLNASTALVDDLRALSRNYKDVAGAEGLMGMLGAKTGLWQDAVEYDAGLKRVAASIQSLIKGVPSNFDIKTFLQKAPKWTNSDAQNRESMKYLIREVESQMKQVRDYYGQQGFGIPDAVSRNLSTLSELNGEFNFRVEKTLPNPPAGLRRGEDGFWMAPSQKTPGAFVRIRDPKTGELLKWRD